MTPISIDRAAQAAIRRSVIGFFLGTVSALLFIVTLLEFDIGSIASSAAGGPGLPLHAFGLFVVTFGFLGLIVGPSLGSADGSARHEA